MTSAYFTRGGSYLRWTVGSGAVDTGYPKPITGGWAGLAGTGFDHDVDASVDLGAGKLYLFRDDVYVRIDQASNAVESDVLPIADNWIGMADVGFADGLDAALNRGDGTACFFKGDQYVVFDIAADKVVAGPAPIADGWGGLADAGFADGLDAAVNWGTGVAYFFKGELYVEHDLVAATTTAPASVAADWTGFGDVGFVPVDTAWVKLTGGPGSGHEPVPGAGSAGAGDCIWWFNGLVAKGPEIPRSTWFPTSTGPNDYLGNGTAIFQYVVHSDGTVRRGQPHMRSGRGSFAWLNNNPGNITAGGGDYGQYPGKVNWHSFMIFPNHDVGFAAIGRLLRGPGYADLGILAAFNRYAPAGDGGNRPDQYAAEVAAAAGVDVNTQIRTLSDDQLLLVQQKIEAIEGSVPGDVLGLDDPGLPAEVRALIG